MKERPILFSTPMVRALLAGTKTQTRRVVKLTSNGHVKESCGHRRWHPADPNSVLACPYGQPGDRLWVRETWADASSSLHMCALYRATDDEPGNGVDRWTPSIHMPRWASRITLKVTGVRVERLQDISGADALAEGIERPQTPIAQSSNELAIWRYKNLWEEINGPESWAANPRVWVVEFKRLESA